MYRVWLALVAAGFCGGVASGQAPVYTAASIVNASDFSPGPFAPNSVLTIFGSNLAFGTASLPATVNGQTVPTELASVTVFIDNTPVPLLYVSPGQVNLLVPPDEVAGQVPLHLVRQGLTGDTVMITLVNAAPALFPAAGNFALAQDFNANYATVSASAPAQPGDLIVLYATGLGATQPLPLTGEIPQAGGLITAFSSLQVLLNGQAIPASTVFYAGITPGFAGLYQVNFYLPKPCSANPLIQLAIGAQVSATGIILAVQ